MLTPYSVGIYLHGVNLNPDVVSDRIGTSPTKSWLKGVERDSKTRAIKTKTGLWKLSAESKSPVLEDHVRELIAKFGSMRGLSVRDIDGVESAVLDIFILLDSSQSSTRAHLSVATLKSVAEIGLELSLTIEILMPDGSLQPTA